MRKTILLLCLISAVSCCKETTMTPVDFSKVKVEDSFWSPILERHAHKTLTACLDQCEFKTGRIHNFARAAKLEEGPFQGVFYDDSDVYKMIEGIAYSLVNYPNSELEARTDKIIDYIAAAQQEDGYLNTYYLLVAPDKRWTDMNMHEMYCAGHLIEAAIAYYHATGKDKLLKTGIRLADYFQEVFGPGKRSWVPGHEEIELALVKLYHETGNKNYLDFSEWLLEQRGHGNGTWKALDYYQDVMPVSELRTIHGHAVRAMYLFSGMADVAAEKNRPDYVEALDSLWEDVTARKMYITGGIGSSARNEGFTTPYDLPNESAYCETCASVGMVLWNHRMNLMKEDAKYVDIMEKCIFNGVLSGISQSGDLFFYDNPLASHGQHRRDPWFGTACCPSNLSRFLPSIGGYVYATTPDAIWVNMYMGNTAEFSVGCTSVKTVMTADYPWNGEISLSVEPSRAKKIALKLRIPEWCKSYECNYPGTFKNGYLTIERKWKKGDEPVKLSLGMEVTLQQADPRVKADVGRRAVQRGPVIYCLEGVDNPAAEWSLTKEDSLSAAYDPDFLGGATLIKASNGLCFIPYYKWANREPAPMEVWVKYE